MYRPLIPAVLLAAAAMLFSFPARGAEPPSREDLPALVAAAIANNPEVKATQARWEMFANRIKHAGRLEDPMLMLKIQNGLIRDPINFHRDTMTQKVVGLSQQLPFWGKRALREEVAAREADSYRWLVEERKLELAKMVKETWYQLYVVDRFSDIVTKNIRIMDDFITLAETRYSVGQGAQQDILRAQVERSRMLDMQISLNQQRESLKTNLNSLLFRPVNTPFGSVPEFTIEPVRQTAGELLQVAMENRPLIKSYSATVARGDAARRLADKEFYPDFTVSLEYMQRERVQDDPGYDMYGLGVTFNLPVFRHHRHEMVAEADATVTMAAEELNSLKNGIGSTIGDLLAQLERRRKLVELYKGGIVPQAEQALESSTIGYRVGKVDFLSLLDSRLTLFKYEREYYESMGDYQMKRAELEAVVGKEL